MENLPVASWILGLSSLIGAITAILAAVLGLSKKARAWAKKIVRKDTNADEIKAELDNIHNELRSIQTAVDAITQENSRQRDVDLAVLRNTITTIYYSHLTDKKLAAYEKEALMKMYEAYTGWGGNSYVVTIVQEMKNWDVVVK